MRSGAESSLSESEATRVEGESRADFLHLSKEVALSQRWGGRWSLCGKKFLSKRARSSSLHRVRPTSLSALVVAQQACRVVCIGNKDLHSRPKRLEDLVVDDPHPNRHRHQRSQIDDQQANARIHEARGEDLEDHEVFSVKAKRELDRVSITSLEHVKRGGGRTDAKPPKQPSQPQRNSATARTRARPSSHPP
jgi:hypothetical protein